MDEPSNETTPKGLRDTKNWYLDCDPLTMVDMDIIKFVHEHAGESILDLGCGIGGYSKTLQNLGHSVKALDVNEEYVEVARTKLGIDVAKYDGNRIPMPDASVDTVMLVEVLEHVPDVQSLVKEVARVARKNVIATVPNCTRAFRRARVVFEHMLDVDHKHFFTAATFEDLFKSCFRSVEVAQIAPLDSEILRELLPRWASFAWDMSARLRLVRPKYSFRLLANASH
jgi:ubiquinone/menaquinone biosynthesis C-methylase UbiE